MSAIKIINKWKEQATPTELIKLNRYEKGVPDHMEEVCKPVVFNDTRPSNCCGAKMDSRPFSPEHCQEKWPLWATADLTKKADFIRLYNGVADNVPEPYQKQEIRDGEGNIMTIIWREDV